MTITLYYMQESPPCNIVLITLELLKINYEKKSVDLSKGEHLTGDLKKVNFNLIFFFEYFINDFFF